LRQLESFDVAHLERLSGLSGRNGYARSSGNHFLSRL
jgi:hypothetical protein